MKENIENSLLRLSNYIENEKYLGYDPYDTLNSWIPFKILGKWPSAVATQIQKRNPVNIRPLLGIKKLQSTKGSGLLLKAYINLYNYIKEDKYKLNANNLKNWILANQTIYKGNYCWGYDYPYSTLTEKVDKGFPTVIHHSYILSALHSYNKKFKDEILTSLLKNSSDFIIKNIPVKEFEEGICFGYHPSSKICCYNASLHATFCLALEYYYTNNNNLFKLIESAVDFVTSMQKENGVWYYGFKSYCDIINDKEDKQIDFHQGFILESIFEIIHLIGYTKPSWETAITKGLTFYRNQQFLDNGRSLWRLPKKYPIDIHNQAQGIITFSKLNSYNPEYLDFSQTIANWTIKNMQDRNGFFYYRKYKYYRNKISYMRWSQAWMLLALSELILHKNNT